MIFPFYAFASADPILPDGGLSSNWAMLVLAGIAAFFLVRTLNRLESDIKTLTSQIRDIGERQAQMKGQIENIGEKIDAEQIADMAVAKLIAMQGGSGGRHWPFNKKEER